MTTFTIVRALIPAAVIFAGILCCCDSPSSPEGAESREEVESRVVRDALRSVESLGYDPACYSARFEAWPSEDELMRFENGIVFLEPRARCQKHELVVVGDSVFWSNDQAEYTDWQAAAVKKMTDAATSRWRPLLECQDLKFAVEEGNQLVFEFSCMDGDRAPALDGGCYVLASRDDLSVAEYYPDIDDCGVSSSLPAEAMEELGVRYLKSVVGDVN